MRERIIIKIRMVLTISGIINIRFLRRMTILLRRVVEVVVILLKKQPMRVMDLLGPLKVTGATIIITIFFLRSMKKKMRVLISSRWESSRSKKR